MPFAPHIIALLEDILSDGFGFHNALDAFIVRAGFPHGRLKAARVVAEERAKTSSRGFSKAPKRYVAQEILASLSSGTEHDDRILAALVTAACKINLNVGSESAKEAQKALLEARKEDRNEAEERRQAERARQNEGEKQREKQRAADAAKRESFRENFIGLTQQSDAQARGYALEKFLNDYFAFENLNPRGSFKLIGEQIDGSFAWGNHTHLVEAKWVAEPVNGASFGAFIYKIEGKTADTRGLFISINGYSTQAIQALKMKGELRFICIDGAHLMRSLAPGGSFSKMLEILWRHASETGEPYMPVSAMQS